MTAASLEHMREEDLVYFPMDFFLASYEKQREAVSGNEGSLSCCPT